MVMEVVNMVTYSNCSLYKSVVVRSLSVVRVRRRLIVVRRSSFDFRPPSAVRFRSSSIVVSSFVVRRCLIVLCRLDCDCRLSFISRVVRLLLFVVR